MPTSIETPHSTLETARFRLRPFRMTDLETAYGWFSDPEVMRYIPPGADRTMEASASRIAKYREHEAKYGFSKWIILDRESGLPIGDAGFFHFADLKRVELGYRLSKAWWKRGVATEVAAGWIKVARPWYGFGKVYAYAHPIHSASLRVMQKVGFCYSHREEINGTEASVYSLDLETKPSEMESTHKTTERSLDKLGMTGL